MYELPLLETIVVEMTWTDDEPYPEADDDPYAADEDDPYAADEDESYAEEEDDEPYAAEDDDESADVVYAADEELSVDVEIWTDPPELPLPLSEGIAVESIVLSALSSRRVGSADTTAERATAALRKEDAMRTISDVAAAKCSRGLTKGVDGVV